MEPNSKRLAGADGLTLHALEWSETGVPLVLLHGFGNEAHFWADLAPAPAPYYRTIAIDLRGHGGPDRGPGSSARAAGTRSRFRLQRRISSSSTAWEDSHRTAANTSWFWARNNGHPLPGSTS